MDYWYLACRWSEGRGWLERALATGAAVPNPVRAKGLLAAGHLAHYQGDGARALPWLDEALALLRALGDVNWRAFALFARGVAAEDRGDYARARADLGEAVATLRATGDEDQLAWFRLHLGIVAYGEGDLAAAATLGEEARALARRFGDEEIVATAVLHLAHVACAREDPAGAAAWFRIVLQEPDWSSTPESLARALAGVAVLAAGCREGERAARLLGAADAVLLTSRSEGIPLTLIEGMAAALPVVATRVGGVPEVVTEGETGLLASAGDADALAAHILRLAGDGDLRRRLGRAGRERARASFDEGRMIAAYDRIYGEAIGRADRTRRPRPSAARGA
jgi:tetratricopeptide (TPR) repeat protein